MINLFSLIFIFLTSGDAPAKFSIKRVYDDAVVLKRHGEPSETFVDRLI